MPLSKVCTIEAFRENVREEMKKVPLDQAVAIARSVLAEACEKEGKPMPKSEKTEADDSKS